MPGPHPGSCASVTVGIAGADGLQQFKKPCSCPRPASDRDPVWGPPHRMHTHTHTHTHTRAHTHMHTHHTHTNGIQHSSSWGQSFTLEPPSGLALPSPAPCASPALGSTLRLSGGRAQIIRRRSRFRAGLSTPRPALGSHVCWRGMGETGLWRPRPLWCLFLHVRRDGQDCARLAVGLGRTPPSRAGWHIQSSLLAWARAEHLLRCPGVGGQVPGCRTV